MILAAGLVHALVLAAPLCIVGGWGALADPAVLIFLLGASALVVGDAVTSRHREPPLSHARTSEPNARASRWAALTGLVLLSLFWTALVERTLLPSPGSSLQVAGAALLLGGVSLRALSVQILGPAFRTEIDLPRGEGTRLVRHSVYRYVRHPSETGLLTAALGAALLLQSLGALVVWSLALLPVTLVRIRLEEHALRRYFGQSYREYVADVGKFLPKHQLL